MGPEWAKRYSSPAPSARQVILHCANRVLFRPGRGDIVGAAIGTGGGTLIGAVFGHVARGFGFGLAGSAVYIVARKGKDLDLPAQTGMLVRMDNTVTVPVASASNASLTGGSR
jgi:uncharacterized membrane protein